MHVIADYLREKRFSEEAYDTASLCLADALGCAILALKYPACTKLLGPVVSGISGNCHVPGTPFVLDPVTAAFNMGTMIRWLDYNDTFLAAEWGHPSDNLGGLLAVAEYRGTSVRELLTAMIQAYEIQGGLALRNSFNQIGFDHVILVKVATAAVATQMLGGSRDQIIDALSQAWIDLGPLRTYRQAPNVGSRKSWAAGDATSRGVWLALLTMRGEQGYPEALTAPKWGLYDVLFQGKPFQFERPFGSYIMENILFKVSFPAEFHAQTAVEAALQLYPQIAGREIERVEIATHQAALKIIDKRGPLKNPADRDHCLQYMVAVALLRGQLTADDYEQERPEVARLREKIKVKENPDYTRDYYDPEKRAIANAVTVYLKGEKLTAEVEYPLGHRRRREEARPAIFQKFEENLATQFPAEKVQKLSALFQNRAQLEQLPVKTLIDYLI